jgi:soluble cytochrome b562
LIAAAGCGKKGEEANAPQAQPAASTAPAVKPEPPKETPPLSPAASSVPTASAAPTAPSVSASDEAGKQAQSDLDRISALIKDGKLAEAETALAALEGKSATLPEATQAKIKAARVSLDAAKAAAANKEADSLLDRIMAMIKDGKTADAEKALSDLRTKSASLPQPIQDKIRAAETALAAKKTAGDVKIPGLPG